MMKTLRYSFLLVLAAFVCGLANASTIRIYKKATTIESGKAYLIAANQSGTLKVATLQTTNYGYLYVEDAEETDGAVEMEGATADYTITSTTGGYTIQMSDNRYLYQTGDYNSFNFSASPTEGQVWTIEAQSDGTFKITNNSVNKYIQYSTGYKSFGSYATEQSESLLPNLYVFDSEREIADDPTAKGTQNNPYSVSDIMAMDANNIPVSGKVWVEGYIRGNVNTQKGNELASGDAVATNLGLGETSTATEVIPVQLPQGTVRTALNILDNPSNVGLLVKVYGTIEKYCGVTGVKSVTNYEITTTGIADVKVNKSFEGVMYNTAGQVVNKSYKGLVIMNGKKFVNK